MFDTARRAALLAVFLLLISAKPQDEPAGKITPLVGIGGGERMQVQESFVRLDPPKISPMHGWIFEYTANGFARVSTEVNQLELKVRVFAQQKKEENNPAGMVAQMALRLWDYNLRRLDRDHARQYDDGRVHFYLAFGGKPGGEQRFDEDDEGGRIRKVNTVYIYQIQNVKDPVELAREIAHEYGHATLPPVGGFTEPEEWANGHLGEKIYMRYLRDELRAGRLHPQDAMGAKAEQLDSFAKKEIDPLCDSVWLNGPDLDALVGTGQRAMDAYTALALYTEQALGHRVFARSLLLTGSTKATDYGPAIILAAEEPNTFVIQPPPHLRGKDIWIPLGKGKLNGLLPLKRKGDWVQVRPVADIVRVINRPG